MAGNPLPLILAAAAAFLLMGKKGGGAESDSTGGDGDGDSTGGDGDGDSTGDGDGDSTGDGDGDSTGDGDGGGGGGPTDIDGGGDGGGGGGFPISGISGAPEFRKVITSVPFSSLNLASGFGSDTKCGRLVFLPQAVGDTLEITGWPLGTYGLAIHGGGEIFQADDAISATAVGDRLLLTKKAPQLGASDFHLRFRGGKQAYGGIDKLRYLFLAGYPQSESWNCPANLKQG